MASPLRARRRRRRRRFPRTRSCPSARGRCWIWLGSRTPRGLGKPTPGSGREWQLLLRFGWIRTSSPRSGKTASCHGTRSGSDRGRLESIGANPIPRSGSADRSGSLSSAGEVRLQRTDLAGCYARRFFSHRATNADEPHPAFRNSLPLSHLARIRVSLPSSE